MIASFKKIKKREGSKNIFFSIFLGIIFLAVIGFLIFSNWKINQRRVELRAKIEELRKETQSLEIKKAELEAGIAQAEKESYLEEKSREHGFDREGEERIVILPPETREEEEKEEKSLWDPRGWWEWLKGKMRD